LPSSFTVAMTTPVCGSAVRPSHLPWRSHWWISLPPRPNSTTVLSVLPSVLGSPWAPTPFWNAVKTLVPIEVRSSGPVSGSVLGVVPPDGMYLWCSFIPKTTCRTVSCETCRAAPAGEAIATPAPAIITLAGMATARAFAACFTVRIM